MADRDDAERRLGLVDRRAQFLSDRRVDQRRILDRRRGDRPGAGGRPRLVGEHSGGPAR